MDAEVRQGWLLVLRFGGLACKVSTRPWMQTETVIAGAFVVGGQGRGVPAAVNAIVWPVLLPPLSRIARHATQHIAYSFLSSNAVVSFVSNQAGRRGHGHGRCAAAACRPGCGRGWIPGGAAQGPRPAMSTGAGRLLAVAPLAQLSNGQFVTSLPPHVVPQPPSTRHAAGPFCPCCCLVCLLAFLCCSAAPCCCPPALSPIGNQPSSALHSGTHVVISSHSLAGKAAAEQRGKMVQGRGEQGRGSSERRQCARGQVFGVAWE